MVVGLWACVGVMPKNVDLFDFWRFLLSTVVSIYVGIYTVRTLVGWLSYFRSSRRTTVMGHYALTLLLRARLRKFGGELLKIGLLLAVLGSVIGLHWALA